MNEYDDRGDPVPPQEGVIDRAKRKTAVPAILMIVFGAITFGLAAVNAVNLPNFGAQVDQAIADNVEKAENDPKLTADQRKEMKEMFDRVGPVVKQVVPPVVYANLAAGALLILGGVCLMRLAAAWLVVIACVVAIVPFTTACCSGLPFGIWGLIALNNPLVRAGYRANRGDVPPTDFE